MDHADTSNLAMDAIFKLLEPRKPRHAMTCDEAVDKLRMDVRALNLPPWQAELLLNAVDEAYDDREKSDEYIASVLRRFDLLEGE